METSLIIVLVPPSAPPPSQRARAAGEHGRARHRQRPEPVDDALLDQIAVVDGDVFALRDQILGLLAGLVVHHDGLEHA